MRIRVAAIIVRNNKLLLVKHCKNNSYYWLLPGGGVEVGETIYESLKRELKEELNVDIGSHELIFVVESMSKDGKHLIQPTFLVKDYNIDKIKLGEDKRVCGFEFFLANQLKDITIYPDINDELFMLLNKDKKAIGRKYILKQWKN